MINAANVMKTCKNTKKMIKTQVLSTLNDYARKKG